MTAEELAAAAADVSIQGIQLHSFRVRITEECGRSFLHLEFEGRDNDIDLVVRHKTRKWRLSPHMTRGEVAQTALKAYLTALEHEARELFRFRGERIFGPHLDVDALVEFLKTNPEQRRP